MNSKSKKWKKVLNKIFGFFAFTISLVLCYMLKNQPRINDYAFLTQYTESKTTQLPTQNQEILQIPFSDEFLYTNDNNFIVPNPESSAHASSLVDLGDRLLLVFFAGSKEGAEDVKIYKSTLFKNSANWNYPQAILDAPTLSKMSGKFIRKLGNPVIFNDNKGEVHLFVVGVSLGGWATSKIYQLKFKNDILENALNGTSYVESQMLDSELSESSGQPEQQTTNELEYVKELKLSPFANLSHLVRTPAIMLENGGFMLPLYHELADKYALVAFFDENSEFRFSKRLNALHNQLQPSIAALDSENCLASFRTAKNFYSNTMFLQKCSDKGNKWSDLIPSNVKNFDSSSVIINIDDEILLLHNDGLENPLVSLYESYGALKVHPRASISLLWMRELGIFERLISIDISLHGTEVSYPSAAVDSEFLHIAYTLDRKNIKYVPLPLDSVRELIKQSREDATHLRGFEFESDENIDDSQWLPVDDFVLG